MLEPAAQRFQPFLEGLCYTRDYDGYLKQGLKAQKSTGGILQDSPFREKLAALVEDTTGQEDKKAAEAAAIVGTAADTTGDYQPKLMIAMKAILADESVDQSTEQNFRTMTVEETREVREFEVNALRAVDIGCQFLVDKDSPQEMSNYMRITERANISAIPQIATACLSTCRVFQVKQPPNQQLGLRL